MDSDLEQFVANHRLPPLVLRREITMTGEPIKGSTLKFALSARQQLHIASTVASIFSKALKERAEIYRRAADEYKEIERRRAAGEIVPDPLWMELSPFKEFLESKRAEAKEVKPSMLEVKAPKEDSAVCNCAETGGPPENCPVHRILYNLP